MRRFAPVVVALLALGAGAAATAQDRAELLASPKQARDVVEPTFESFSRERLLEEIDVVSSRSYAVYGFNTPEVQVLLPRCDNSAYAQVEFDEPQLVDGDGQAVEFERERGIYDPDSHSDEIRFASSGGADPVQFDRARGKIRVRFPLRMRTRLVRAGDGGGGDTGVTIDGPFVSLVEGDEALPEAATFSGITALRAYDAGGAQIERHPSVSYATADGSSSRTLAFWGRVAAVKIDIVEEWIALELSYDLPAAPPLPQSRVGTAPPAGERASATAGGKVTKQVLEPRPTAEAPLEAVEAASVSAAAVPLEAVEAGSVSAAEARRRLAELGYRTVDDSMFVMSAVRGETEAVRMFLAAGLSVDARSDDRTPLLSAAMYGHVETAKVLIAAGADVEAADANGSTALIWAAQKCDATELVSALVAAGANVKATAKGGATPRMMAEVMGCADNLAALERAGG